MKKITLVILLLSVVWGSFAQTGPCSAAIPVTLPFTTTDNTASHGDLFPGSPGAMCGTNNSYLYGHEAIYSYTAAFTGTINLYLSTNTANVGLFVYSGCENIGQTCLAGINNQQITENTISLESFPVTLGTQYYFVVSTMAPTEGADFSLNISQNTCFIATADFTVVSDCGITGQFLVEVDIQEMGSASSLLIFDNIESEQYASEAGIFTFGPYPNGEDVVITILNTNDANCVITSAVQTQTVCAPVNNICSGAIDLTLQESPLSGTTIGATNQHYPACVPFDESSDVYYSMVVPHGTTLSISLSAPDFDAVVSAYIGDCSSMANIACFTTSEYPYYTYQNLSGENKTFYWVVDGYNGSAGTYLVEWETNNCMIPEAVFTVNADCGNNQFFVTADIFTLGSASSVTITDNWGIAEQTVSTTGEIQLGPYPGDSAVYFYITNDDDANCYFTSYDITAEPCPPTCTNATVNYGINLDCQNDLGFYVTADVSSMGSATAISIGDQISDPIIVTTTGSYQFGPYPHYSTVNFTVTDTEDSSCSQSTSLTSYSVCPPPNDGCANAITLIAGDSPEATIIMANSTGATLSSLLPFPTCGNMYFNVYGKDIWFTVTVPASGDIFIETSPSGETGNGIMADTVLQVYSGNCDVLTLLECNNDDGTDSYSLASVTGRPVGEVLYIRAFGNHGMSGSFKIAAYDESLSVTPVKQNTLISYPNPVTDVLNLEYSADIQSVEIFNMLGQQVYAKFINAYQSQIDMSSMNSGTYIVKVAIDNQIKVIKVMKQ